MEWNKKVFTDISSDTGKNTIVLSEMDIDINFDIPSFSFDGNAADSNIDSDNNEKGKFNILWPVTQLNEDIWKLFKLFWNLFQISRKSLNWFLRLFFSMNFFKLLNYSLTNQHDNIFRILITTDKNVWASSNSTWKNKFVALNILM